MSRATSRTFWLPVAALLLLTRVPVAAKFLNIDNVNLAYALDHFDPRIHQPQPPGYPFFVVFAKILNLFLRNPETTFLVIAVLISALTLPVIYALGSRMFDEWTGRAAVCLLLVNPSFWHSALEGPLRVNLALFSALTAYCGWRAWNGERTYVYWGAVALGIGSGFRPDLLVYLGPLWLASALVGTRSIKTVFAGVTLLAGIVLVWVAILAYAVGGPGELYNLISTYLINQSKPASVVLGASAQSWQRQISRLVIWNGLAVLGWLLAVPLFLVSRNRVGLFSGHLIFLKIWFVPGIIAQALIHVDSSGHTLFATTGLCLLGAYVLRAGLQQWAIEDTGLFVAAAVSIILFMNFVPLPAAGSPGGIRSAFANATFETSIDNVRWLDDIHGSSLKELREWTVPDRRTVIIGQDAVQQGNWFLNWRIARYYLPDADIRMAATQKTPAETAEVRGSAVSAARSGSPVEIKVPPHSRVLWLVQNGGPLYMALSKAGALHGGPHVFYTDIDEGSAPLRALDFQIVPAP